MNYLVITDNTITNIVVADETVAAEMGLQPWYEGARIGDPYDPPPSPEPEPTLDELETTKADKTEVSAVWDQMAAAYSEGVQEA